MLRWSDLTADGKWALMGLAAGLVATVAGLVFLTLHR